MRIMTILGIAAVIAGCAKSDAPPAADTGMAMEPAPAPVAPAALSLADVAGKWTVRVMGETSDSTLSTYVLTATADTAGWVFSFPNGKPIPMRVTSVSGDSIVTTAGPFPSSLRKGAQVSTVGTFRMQDGKMVGTTIARYPGAGADSVARLRIEGTRAQ